MFVLLALQPTVSYDSCHADHPARPHALQRIQQSCSADELKKFVDASDVFDFSGDVTIINDNGAGAAVL